MTHLGLIDEKLPEVDQCLLRARLYIRKGKKRIKKGEISTGIMVLYDAFIFSLYWYFLSDKMLKPLLINGNGTPNDEEHLYLILLSYGRISGTFDYDKFLKLTTKALNNKLNKPECEMIIKEFDSFMEELEVIPYNENNLYISAHLSNLTV